MIKVTTCETASNTYLVSLETQFKAFIHKHFQFKAATVYKEVKIRCLFPDFISQKFTSKEIQWPQKTVFARKCYESFIDCVLSPLLKMWDSHKGFRDTTCCTDVFSSCLILHGSECPLKVILFFQPLHSNHNFRGLATDEDIIHHPTDTLPECSEINVGGGGFTVYLAL